jgi:hypothetical protein
MRTPFKPWMIAAALVITPVLVFGAEAPTSPYPECTTKPTEGDVAGAKGAFQAGQASFNEADYKTAINYWEDAFRRDCTATALLLNLARAYELNGQKHHAVLALQTYIQRNPKSPQLDQLQRRIDVLKKEIAKAGAAQPGASASSASPSASATSSAVPQPSASAASSSGAPETPPGANGSRPIYPLIVAGAGGLIAIVGGGLWLKATSDYNNFSKQCPGFQGCSADVTSGGNSALNRERLWGGVAIGGLVVAAGGVVWYLLEPHGANSTAARQPSTTPELSPAVGPGYAGMAVSGAF